MVITEPAEPRVGLLGLGSKRYPSNMQRMRNKEAFKGTQKSSKRKKGSAGRVKPDQRKKNGGKKKRKRKYKSVASPCQMCCRCQFHHATPKKNSVKA